MTVFLIGGGARSGKSSRALQIARERAMGKSILFIATAQASDDEMLDRIAMHKKERDAQFLLIEEPLDLVSALSRNMEIEVCIVDCLTLWLSNNFESFNDSAFSDVINAAELRNGMVIFITNEVGEGIVPMHPVSRKFRDMSGRMNQFFAYAAEEVSFMRFGIEQKLK
jgi:adenosyl cobinamide kinase/adenosyl cobinamide phosphate guanylyltransferase